MDNPDQYRRNFLAFLWHALFLAFVSTFIDVNTILSSFILNIGGTNFHVGLLTGISVGLPLITQLLFAGFLSGRKRKKPYLLLGIYLRVLALFGMGYTLSISEHGGQGRLLGLIFLWIGIFAVSGAFAGISYTDLLGKIFVGRQRKRFLIFKQFVSAVAMLISAVTVRQIVISIPYPTNYTVTFFAASGLLFVAALGFVMIGEAPGRGNRDQNLLSILKSIPGILAADKNLLNYIFMMNLASLGFTVIPFYVAFSKKLYGLEQHQIGNFLLLLFLGMIVSTFVWNQVSKRYKFKGIFLGFILIGSLLPLVAVLLSRYGVGVYQWLFFPAGFSFAAYKIGMEGILLEISDDDNRAIYAGISGTMSLTTAVFPLLAGLFIEVLGFRVIFSMIFFLVLAAVFFLKRIVCSSTD